MKKLVFTIAALGAFSIANAQELQPANQTPKKSTTDEKATTTSPKKGGAQVENGALGTSSTSTTSTTEPKKSGTRMAINEKGLPGEKKPANNTKSPK